jgi:hypothetical protein
MTDDPNKRERRPLSFPDWDTYRRFQDHLRVCFDSEDISDAVVQQVGSPCTGWETDPAKPLTAWTAHTTVDLVIFSTECLGQAMAANLSVDRSLTWQGKYVRLLSHTDSTGRGLSETPIGRKLSALAAHWTSLLPGHPEVQFTLCLASAPFAEGPFEGAIVVLAPATLAKPT